MKWYKHDPTAFLEGVIGLTAEERGFYITLIDLLYARDGHNVTDELVCSAMRCNPRTWRAVKSRLMACGKVRENNRTLTANRVELVLNEARMKGQLGAISFEISGLQKEQKSPRTRKKEYTSYVAALEESHNQKKKRKNRSARSLASALNDGALTRSPKASARPTKISDELTALVAAHKDKP